MYLTLCDVLTVSNTDTQKNTVPVIAFVLNALEYHEGACQAPNSCVNCNEGHNNWSKECKQYKIEKEIQKIAAVDKLSISDARKRLKVIQPDFSYPTYSNALNGIAFSNKPTQSNISTQLNTLTTNIHSLSKNISTESNKGNQSTENPNTSTQNNKLPDKNTTKNINTNNITSFQQAHCSKAGEPIQIQKNNEQSQSLVFNIDEPSDDDIYT